MSIALSEFWTRLVRVGITDSDRCRELAAAYQRAHGGTPPSSAKSLAKFLVQDSQLSKFQARSLLSDNPDRLRLGDWLLINEQGSVPFSNWLNVRNLVDGREGMLLQATPEALTGGRDLWLDAHQGISGSHLQEFQCDAEPTLTLVFSPLPNGRSLQDWVDRKGLISKENAIEIGVALAEALQVMHARPLVHGGPRLDRVWMGKDGSVTLLRDPSGPPLSPWESEPAAWLETTDAPACYSAPEFVDQARPCDVATDIYSLGCLLFRITTGRPAVESTSIPEAITQHASEIPAELNDAIQQREAGDPFFRVIAYAMSKNPEARFASADQLASALNAIRSLVTSETVSEQAGETELPPSETAVPPKEAPRPTSEPEAPPRVVTTREDSSTKSVAAKRSDRSQSETYRPAEKPSRSSKSSAPSEIKKQKESSDKQRTPQSHSPKQRESNTYTSDAVDRKSSSKAKAVEKSKGKKEKKPNGERDKKSSASASSTTPGSGIAAKTSPPSDSDPNQGKRLTRVVRESAATNPIEVPSDAVPPVEAEPPKPPQPPLAPNVAVSPPAVETTDSSAMSFSLNSEPGNEAATTNPESPKREVAPARRRRKKKDRKAPIVLGGLCVAVLILLVGLVVPKSGDEVVETPRRRPPIPANIPSVTNQPSEEETLPTTEEAAEGYQLVSDPSLLYVPPFDADSEPPSLELLPPGPAVIVSWDVDAILRGEHGPDLVESLSPDLDRLMQRVATMAKIPLDQMSRCTVALHPGSAGWPETSLSVELREPQDRKELIDLWEVGASRTSTGATIYAGDTVESMAFYFSESSESETVSRFAVGTIKRISEVAEAEGGSIPLASSLQRLWDGASGEADVVALITPNFLFADGREMLRSTLPELIDPLKSVLIPDVAAILVTAHTQSDHYYFEARLAPSGGTSEAALMRRLQSTIESWPQWAEDFIVTSVPDASWRLLASKLPGMMGFVSDQFRYGISDSVIIANAYLPVEAVPQVSVAVAFAMNTTGQAVSTATVSAEPPLTVEEMLDRKMAVSFDQESLEFALDAIVQAFREDLPKGSTMPPTRIIGADLEAGGITQNQQVVNFSKSDIPLRTVLTDLVVGANPDKSSTGPKDPKQALIWVVNKDSSGKTEILITTRKAADGKYELPAEFQES